MRLFGFQFQCDHSPAWEIHTVKLNCFADFSFIAKFVDVCARTKPLLERNLLVVKGTDTVIVIVKRTRAQHNSVARDIFNQYFQYCTISARNHK